MKKILIFNSLFFLLLILGSFVTQAQGIKLGGTRTGLHPGDTVMIPLRVTGNSVHTVEIDFNYDQSVLAPQANIFSQVYFPPIGLSWQPSPYYSSSIYNFVFNSGSTSVPLPNMTDRLIGYFCFIYTGGPSGLTTIHLRQSPSLPYCRFWNAIGTLIPVSTFSSDFSIGGTTGLSSTVLYSIPTGGPLDWDSPDSWSTTPSGSAGTTLTPAKCFDVVIQGDEIQINGLIIEGPANCNNLTINPAGKLTMNSIHPFTVNGNMDIQGDATGTGSFVDYGTTTVTGTTTVARAMTGNWIHGNTLYQSHLISSPVAGQSNSIFTGSLMNAWNEGTQHWDSLTLPFITMNVGTGYDLAPVNGGITAIFSGVLNSGDKTISGLTKSGSGTYSGFNLIGNPFPSAINWNTSVIPTSVYNFAWVWNGGAWLTIDRTLGSGGIIAAEQGFFVQASGAGSVKIPSSVRTHGATFYKSTASDLLTLKVEGNNYWDQTQIHLNSASTAGYDAEYDALKWMGSAEAPQIYSMLPDVQLSINSLPNLTGSPVIPFGFAAGSVNNFTITTSGIASFAPGTEFYLEDIVANKVQNLKLNPIYTFNAAPGQQEHRFNLHFSPVGIQESNTVAGIKIYSAEKTIYVNIPTDMNGTIVVYNLLGNEITSSVIQSHSLNKINLNVPSGFYLVKVAGDTYTSTGKVFIK